MGRKLVIGAVTVMAVAFLFTRYDSLNPFLQAQRGVIWFWGDDIHGQDSAVVPFRWIAAVCLAFAAYGLYRVGQKTD